MLDIYIDADGCPVKEEVYRVASRYSLKVFVVANKRLVTPNETNVQMIVSDGTFDGADDWIVEHAGHGDIVITADIINSWLIGPVHTCCDILTSRRPFSSNPPASFTF